MGKQPKNCEGRYKLKHYNILPSEEENEENGEKILRLQFPKLFYLN
jgi:hypothetical protein